MKKSLLLGVALSIGLFASAQQRDLSRTFTAVERPVDNGRSLSEVVSTSQGGDQYGGLLNRSGEIVKTQISTSSNVYGIFSLEQTVLTVHPDINLVAFGNRAGGPMGATGNDLKVVYSTDQGENWTNFVITPGVTGNNYRYPSVATYNPAGNTDPANMYAIFSGPYTQASWVGQYFGSVKFDGSTDKFVTYEPNEGNVYLNHMNIGLNVTPAGKVHVASQRLNGSEASYTSDGWEVLNGAFNTATHQVDWELPRVKVQPELGDEGRLDANSLVFSPDGSVGYLMGTAIDLDETYNPYGIEWPVVYKTTDDGQTWEKTEPFDFSEIGIFNEMLFPLRADLETVVPRWYNKWIGGNRNNGAVVDKNGNLHIAGVVLGTFSVDPDSLTQFYSEQPMLVFDVFTNGDGTWNAQFIDTLRSEPVADADTPFGMGWDQRIQMSRTDDGSKIFVSWADTDPLLWGNDVTQNTQPDIFVWSYDINTNMYTSAVNKTAMGDFWGDNLWLHAGDKVLTSGDEYIIPLTTSASTATGGTMDDAMAHFYVRNIGFTEGDYTIQEVKSIDPASNASVSQNYPNPFSKITSISVTLNKKANVSIEVYNLMGQKVSGITSRTLEAGTHNISIDCANLKAGVYTYSVIANGERVSNKMTVK